MSAASFRMIQVTPGCVWYTLCSRTCATSPALRALKALVSVEITRSLRQDMSPSSSMLMARSSSSCDLIGVRRCPATCNERGMWQVLLD